MIKENTENVTKNSQCLISPEIVQSAFIKSSSYLTRPSKIISILAPDKFKTHLRQMRVTLKVYNGRYGKQLLFLTQTAGRDQVH